MAYDPRFHDIFPRKDGVNEVRIKEGAPINKRTGAVNPNGQWGAWKWQRMGDSNIEQPVCTKTGKPFYKSGK